MRNFVKITGIMVIVALVATLAVAFTGCSGGNNEGGISNPYRQGMEDFPAMINALNTKVIDGYVAEEPGAVENCASNQNFVYIPLKNNDTGFACSADDTAIAVGLKKGSALTARVNAALANISEAERLQLMLRATAYSTGSNVTEDAGDDVVAAGGESGKAKLYVGLECAYAPFNFTQSDNSNGAVPIYNTNKVQIAGYANGYDVMIAKRIAEALNMELAVVKMEWDPLIPAVMAGTIDMIIAGMSPTAERKQSIDFSDAYYNSQLVVVVRKDGPYADAKSLDDLKGAKITAQSGTFHLDALNDYIQNNR